MAKMDDAIGSHAERNPARTKSPATRKSQLAASRIGLLRLGGAVYPS